MPAVVADTHALVWFLTNVAELSPAADQALTNAAGAGDPIYLSAISLIELQYLVDGRRLAPEVLAMVWHEVHDETSVVTLVPVSAGIAEALARVPRDQIPDMPDRIIAATALALDLPLVTRDHHIRAAAIRTIW